MLVQLPLGFRRRRGYFTRLMAFAGPLAVRLRTVEPVANVRAHGGVGDFGIVLAQGWPAGRGIEEPIEDQHLAQCAGGIASARYTRVGWMSTPVKSRMV
jgi:hypothetical protein